MPASKPFNKMKRSKEIGGRLTGGLTLVWILEANKAANRLQAMQPMKMALKLRLLLNAEIIAVDTEEDEEKNKKSTRLSKIEEKKNFVLRK